MLACARIGAPHSVIFGGFSAKALVDRINDAQAVAVITQDGASAAAAKSSSRPPSTRPSSTLPSVKHVIVCKRTGSAVDMKRARSLVARADGESSDQSRPSRSTPSIRSTSFTRRARPASRRAWCTPPPATRCGTYLTTKMCLRSEGRRHLLVHRRHRLGHRPQLHRVRSAAERRDGA